MNTKYDPQVLFLRWVRMAQEAGSPMGAEVCICVPIVSCPGPSLASLSYTGAARAGHCFVHVSPSGAATLRGR